MSISPTDQGNLHNFLNDSEYKADKRSASASTYGSPRWSLLLSDSDRVGLWQGEIIISLGQVEGLHWAASEAKYEPGS